MAHNPYAPPKAEPDEPEVGVSRIVLLLVAGMFIAYGVYQILQAGISPSLLGVPIGLVSALGGVGLVLSRPWSRFCIYLVSIAVVGSWLYYSVLAAQSHEWPSKTALVISWSISLFPVVVAVGGSYLVAKHFRRRRRTAAFE